MISIIVVTQPNLRVSDAMRCMHAERCPGHGPAGPSRASAQGRSTTVTVTPRVPVVLSEYQREQLIRWVSTPGTPARVVRRSRIILQLASGYSVHRRIAGADDQ